MNVQRENKGKVEVCDLNTCFGYDPKNHVLFELCESTQYQNNDNSLSSCARCFEFVLGNLGPLGPLWSTTSFLEGHCCVYVLFISKMVDIPFAWLKQNPD